MKTRSFDDIAHAMAWAETEEEKARLQAEHLALSEEVAIALLAAGNIPAYQRMIA